MILIRRPWTRQPQGLASGVVAPNLIGAWSFGSGWINLVTGVRGTTVGTTSIVPDMPGLVFDRTGLLNVGNFPSIQAAQSKFTIIARIRTTNTTMSGICSYRNGGAGGTAFVVNRTSGRISVYSSGWMDGPSGITTGTWHVVSAVITGPGVRMSIDGGPVTTGTNNIEAGFGYVSIGAWDTGSSGTARSLISDVFLFDAALSDGLVSDYSQNIYKILPPRTIHIPMTAAGDSLPTLTGITLSNITTSGYRATVAGS